MPSRIASSRNSAPASRAIAAKAQPRAASGPQKATDAPAPKRPGWSPGARKSAEPKRSEASSGGSRASGLSRKSDRDLMVEHYNLALKQRNIRTPEGQARLAALDAEIDRRGGYARLRAGLED